MKQFSGLRHTMVLLLLIPILFPTWAFADSDTGKKLPADAHRINANEFKGFDKCLISEQLINTVDRLFAEREPSVKVEGAWTYEIKSRVMGLPVRAIEIGVCDANGERACGWGAYVAVTVTKKLSDARRHLKMKTGIDFTKEERDEETEVTLRPVLKAGKKTNESILACDPGGL